MNAIGADPEALRDLSLRFRKLQAQLETSRSQLDLQLRNARWSGYDADHFRRVWFQHHRSNLIRTAELCRSSSALLQRQADEQVRASDDLGLNASVRPGQSPTLNTHTPGVEVVSSAGAIPTSVTELHAGAAVTIASVLLGTTHDIRIERFADGTSSVTFTGVGNVGLKGTVGGSVSLKGPLAAGTSASAEASIGVLKRQTYVVDDADVWELIAAVELEDAGKRVVASADRLGGGIAVSAGASLGNWLMGRIPDSVKRLTKALVPGVFRSSPTVEEELFQVHVAADAAVSGLPIVGPFASIGTDLVIRYGHSRGTGGSSQILELDGKLATEIHSQLIGESERSVGNKNAGSTVPTLRIEIPDSPTDGSGRPPIVITAVTTDGGTVRQSTTYIDPSKLVDAGLAARTEMVVGRLGAGDVNGAVQVLTGLQVSDRAADTTTAVFTTDDFSGGVGAEAGEGISVGVDLEGGVLHYKRIN